MTQFKVGDEVVAFAGICPISHNYGKHNCRAVVTKVGRKFYSITSIGPDVKVPLVDDGRSWTIHTVEEGKKLYRQALIEHRAYRTDAFIDECVEAL